MSYTTEHLAEAAQVLARLDHAAIERVAALLAQLREGGGRLFILGVGGSAANASHAVNDFRKLASIEAYAPDGQRLRVDGAHQRRGLGDHLRRLAARQPAERQDMLLVLSVGGGDLERNISPNLVRALEYAKKVGARICGVVGRDGGYTAKVADACVIIPTVNPQTVTPHAEAFQAVIWHLLVSHPLVSRQTAKWESEKPQHP